MLRAAQLVLDRSGFPASHKVEMSPEEVDATLVAVLGIPVSQLPTIDVPALPVSSDPMDASDLMDGGNLMDGRGK